MADACILFHSFHKGSIRLLLSDAEHGNITFHRCQREDIEIIVQYSHCRTAQLGSQRLRFLRIDAIAHSADPKLRLAVSQTKHILVHQYLAALGIKFVLTQLSRLHCIYQLLHRIGVDQLLILGRKLFDLRLIGLGGGSGAFVDGVLHLLNKRFIRLCALLLEIVGIVQPLVV